MKRRTYLEEASDITTPADRMYALLSVYRTNAKKRTALWEALARNPNAPVDILERLIRKGVGKAVTENPALDLILLADPNWPKEIYVKAILLGQSERPLPSIATALKCPHESMVDAIIAQGALRSYGHMLEKKRFHAFCQSMEKESEQYR